MAVSWTGWDAAGIVAYLKELFGDGWSLDSAKAAEVNKAIYNAWVEAQVFMPHADAESVADDETVQPSVINVYWFKKSLADAGPLIDGLSPLVAALRQDARAWFEDTIRDGQMSEGIHTFETS